MIVAFILILCNIRFQLQQYLAVSLFVVQDPLCEFQSNFRWVAPRTANEKMVC